MQDRESISINSSDTSISKSKQLKAAVPASKISALSSGQFIGMVADDPQERIKLKAFYNEILNDHDALKKEIERYVEIPPIREISIVEVQANYLKIKKEIVEIT
jgi:uncharacterized protein YdcH (DUF465 family)